MGELTKAQFEMLVQVEAEEGRYRVECDQSDLKALHDAGYVTYQKNSSRQGPAWEFVLPTLAGRAILTQKGE